MAMNAADDTDRSCSATHQPSVMNAPFPPSRHLPLATRHVSDLPGTVNRVEIVVSHRKQATEPLSTRNVPVHAFFQIPGECFDGLA